MDVKQNDGRSQLGESATTDEVVAGLANLDRIVATQARGSARQSVGRTSTGANVSGVVVGTIVGMRHDGAPLVWFKSIEPGESLLARSMVTHPEEFVGREVALMFEDGDMSMPIIIGPIQVPDAPTPGEYGDPSEQLWVRIDDDDIELRGKREITLRCGKASITLTKSGKIILRGKYIVSRSEGVNRIKGGSVQIN